METNPNTITAIIQALKGIEQGFHYLYKSHNKSIMLICMRYLNSKEEAEDLMQDAFVQIFRQLHQFDTTKGSFYNWIYTVTVNTVLQHLRKKRLSFTDILNNEALQLTMSHDQDVISDLDLQSIISKLQSMPLGYRTVFNLYCIEGYNHKEIAEKLGITESTSKTQLMKSKSLARQILSSEFEISRAQ